jgi:hypothetical protein
VGGAVYLAVLNFAADETVLLNKENNLPPMVMVQPTYAFDRTGKGGSWLGMDVEDLAW